MRLFFPDELIQGAGRGGVPCCLRGSLRGPQAKCRWGLLCRACLWDEVMGQENKCLCGERKSDKYLSVHEKGPFDSICWICVECPGERGPGHGDRQRGRGCPGLPQRTVSATGWLGDGPRGTRAHT